MRNTILPHQGFHLKPRSLERLAYERAASEFLDKFAKHPDVCGIYRFGSIRNPGISDLDFIVVFKNQLSLPISRDFGYDFFSEETSYILSHNPIIIPEDLLPHLWKLYPILGDILVCYGSPWSPDSETPDMQDYIAIILMMICVRYPRLFIHLINQEILDVRLSLQVVNALRHTFALAEKLGLQTNSGASGLFREIDRIQRDWFEMPFGQAIDSLLDILDTAMLVSAALVQDLSVYAFIRFCKESRALPVNETTLVGRYKFGSYLFARLPADADLVGLTKNIWRETGELMGLLPETFLVGLLAFVQYGGALGKIVSGQLSLHKGSEEILHRIIPNAGLDIAHQFERLFQFYSKNPIDIAMYPDPYRLAATGLSVKKSGSISSSLWLMSTLKGIRQHCSLQRAGIDRCLLGFHYLGI